MWFDRVTAALRRLYRDGAAPPPAAPEALERALLAEHARLYPAPARGWLAAHRFALASVGAGVVAVAACQVPVDYERGFGASVVCEAPRETWPKVQIEALADALADELAAHRVAVRGHDDGGPRRSFGIDLWGEDVDDEALLAAVQVHAPELPAGACRATPLQGTVHGTLGGRLGYGLLAIDIDHNDAEAARLEIMRELERTGLQGTADVQIHDDGDGKREVKIHIEAYRTD